ncbi:polyphosphate:AMP phosphotransferase [Methanocella sp. CWC-04]|uniref:Polyphosphate:AMP phosphotransferase n=1 Tax=Methanooceanicella nereidis TaxID=2052831 RepID=A0AAP2RGP6_9EURY|nr:polyphosphate:AMP phosphotransferase [Methanocella sp. CWC-04]MCD1295840.1 polyphosphate:AMP phosphotransferase [Methanocella sp. CWC-04]
MFEKIDLTKKMDKKEYDRIFPDLEIRLGELQRQARDKKVPIMIVFEGWDASGKGELINDLILPLDPRGFNVYQISKPDKEESLRPFFWRFWTRTPAGGRIAVFEKSWYRRTLAEKLDIDLKKKDPLRSVKNFECFDKVNYFEKQLANEGYVIIKLFLHISKKEQKKRFDKLEKNSLTSWIISKEDWNLHKNYNKYVPVIEKIIESTDTEYAPWTIIKANDKRFARVKIFDTVIKAIENKLEQLDSERTNDKQDIRSEIPGIKNMSTSILEKVDMSRSLTADEYKKKLKIYQDRIKEIQYEAFIKKIPIIIVYEGWDASGKGGNIKRLTENLDPRGYEVVPISSPDDYERSHHYLWRFWKEFPKAGHITIFDRSWYGRVLVERVEGLCSQEEWKRAYGEINEMEETLVDFGSVLIKFWLHIDRDVQFERFKFREQDVHKKWKITDEDWRNRSKWDDYAVAIDEMLLRTSTTYAPWTIIESNDKYYARIKTLKTVIEEVEKAF